MIPLPRRTPGSRVRLADVATEAGVSKALASRVLNSDPRLAVRLATRDRIIEAAARLGYRPHAAARALNRSQAGAFGLLIPNLTNPVFATISRGAVERALERDVAVLLIEDRMPKDADELVRSLLQGGRTDGVIVASAHPKHPLLRTLERHAVPHVFAHRAVSGSGRNVTMLDQEASALAVEHLAGLGHREIAYVAGPRSLSTSQRLARGFAGRAAELGLKHAPVLHVEYSESGGVEAARTLLQRKLRPTAICTSSVTQAVGVLHVAWQLGLQIPDDFSLLACGELALADFLRPPLTTVQLPFAELGAAAVDALIDQLHGGEPRNVVVETPPEIVARSSTATPGSGGRDRSGAARDGRSTTNCGDIR